jgi:hypothetical protein
MFGRTPPQMLSDINTGIKHDIQKLQALLRAVGSDCLVWELHERKCMYFCLRRQAMSPGAGR